MALLGMLAAGAAVGARNASNQSVAAQNDMEMRQATSDMESRREALRQQYLEKRYETKRADAKEAAKNNALLEEAKYQRTRADKIADTEISHKQKVELEGIKESGRNKRAGERNAILRDKSSSSGGKSSNSITLDNGEEFVPNDADSKNAANLVKIGAAKNIPEAYEIIYAQKFSSQAAGSMAGLTEGTIPAARNMSRGLLNGGAPSGAQAPTIQRLQFNPKTGGF